MRPTLIRLIAGGALGVAFSIALTLPGSVVFPDEPPIRLLTAPEGQTAAVLHAARVVERPSRAPAPSRVVVRRVSVPTAGTVPATSAVLYAPPRSTPPQKPVERAPAPVEQPVTRPPAPPAAPVTKPAEEPEKADEPERANAPRADTQEKADKPQKADEPEKADEPLKAEKPTAEKSRKSEKPKKAEKPKTAEKPNNTKQPTDPGSEKLDKPDRKRDRKD